METPHINSCTPFLQKHFFQSVMGQLVKLVFLSSAVHQTTFCLKSTLPFAVGQVQDVGLIFLSVIATSVLDICGKAGQSSDVALGTVLVCLLIATFSVGVFIVGIGKIQAKAGSSISHSQKHVQMRSIMH